MDLKIGRKIKPEISFRGKKITYIYNQNHILPQFHVRVVGIIQISPETKKKFKL